MEYHIALQRRMFPFRPQATATTPRQPYTGIRMVDERGVDVVNGAKFTHIDTTRFHDYTAYVARGGYLSEHDLKTPFHLLEGEPAARQVEIRRQQEHTQTRKQNELLTRQRQQEAEGEGTKNGAKAKKIRIQDPSSATAAAAAIDSTMVAYAEDYYFRRKNHCEQQ